ncbi:MULTISPECIES: hypothetical protein [Butyricimonas]|uniref:hypothetical protein n=1 Tax=Butyricimonas TaxID=574697 RepID=UPI001651F303|nr:MULTISPECIES: hypothetical protein [Butyricimonas]
MMSFSHAMTLVNSSGACFRGSTSTSGSFFVVVTTSLLFLFRLVKRLLHLVPLLSGGKLSRNTRLRSRVSGTSSVKPETFAFCSAFSTGFFWLLALEMISPLEIVAKVSFAELPLFLIIPVYLSFGIMIGFS